MWCIIIFLGNSPCFEDIDYQQRYHKLNIIIFHIRRWLLSMAAVEPVADSTEGGGGALGDSAPPSNKSSTYTD